MFSHYRFTPKDDVKSYNIYGVTVLEVEVDILTGQHLVNILITFYPCKLITFSGLEVNFYQLER